MTLFYIFILWLVSWLAASSLTGGYIGLGIGASLFVLLLVTALSEFAAYVEFGEFNLLHILLAIPLIGFLISLVCGLAFSSLIFFKIAAGAVILNAIFGTLHALIEANQS